MRTKRDIQREQLKNELRGTIIEFCKKNEEINQHDIIVAISELLTSESWALIKHYDIKEREGE